jgi:hypothetical protein
MSSLQLAAFQWPKETTQMNFSEIDVTKMINQVGLATASRTPLMLLHHG